MKLSAATRQFVHVFMPQVVKGISCNGSTAAILGKEGIVETITDIVKGLSKKKFCPKLKVALEAQVMLTRSGTEASCSVILR
jgi:hypothetical protein